MTATGVAGIEDLSLSAACGALEEHQCGCTENAADLVAEAMEELRQEAKRGERKAEGELAWTLSCSIATQYVHEQTARTCAPHSQECQ